MKKLGSIITVCCLLVVVSMMSWSCKKKEVQTPTTQSVTENPAVTKENPAITQTGTEPESIKTLQAIALTNFNEQMASVFAESPDKDAKIKVFEESMDNLAQEYYRYYVEETKQGIDVAKANFTAFLKDFKSTDGVGLSKDSTPFYLEKVKAK